MCTDFFPSDAIEVPARRPGFGTRASKMTGKIFLALVTCGVWREAATTRAPLAAQGTPWGAQRTGSPDARPQSRHTRALGLLPDMIRPALPTGHSLAPVWDDSLFPSFPKV